MQPWPTLAWRASVFRASIKRCEMKGKVPSNLSMELCSLIDPRLTASRILLLKKLSALPKSSSQVMAELELELWRPHVVL